MKVLILSPVLFASPTAPVETDQSLTAMLGPIEDTQKRRRPIAQLLCTAITILVACRNPPTGAPPSQLSLVQGPPLAGVPGWPLADTLKVQVVDPAGTPQSGVPVMWTVTQGGGSVAEVNAATDAGGIAAAVWTLGDRSGRNALRAATLDESSVSFQVDGTGLRAQRVSSGYNKGCGLVDGAMWCWGLGGDTAQPVSRRGLFGWYDESPGPIDHNSNFVDLAVSASSHCGLDSQMEVWCADGNEFQLTRASGLPSMRRIVGAGLYFFPGYYCGLTVSDSTAWCWELHAPAQPVPGSRAFIDLWLEGRTVGLMACGVLADSAAACWGDGPLGDGTTNPSATPVPVSGSHRFAELAVGYRFACGRTAPGAVWCWGQDYQGETVLQDVLTPTQIATGAYRIAAGQEWVQMLSAGPMMRWEGAGLSPVSWPRGLSGLSVKGFAVNAMSCLHLVDDQVYCYDEMWNYGSWLAFDAYSPVQPIRRFPAAP